MLRRLLAPLPGFQPQQHTVTAKGLSAPACAAGSSGYNWEQIKDSFLSVCTRESPYLGDHFG